MVDLVELNKQVRKAMLESGNQTLRVVADLDAVIGPHILGLAQQYGEQNMREGVGPKPSDYVTGVILYLFAQAEEIHLQLSSKLSGRDEEMSIEFFKSIAHNLIDIDPRRALGSIITAGADLNKIHEEYMKGEEDEAPETC